MPNLRLTTTASCQGGYGYISLSGIAGPGASYTYSLVRRSDGTELGTGSIARTQLPLDFDGLYDDTYELTLVDNADPNNIGTDSVTISCGTINPGGGGAGSCTLEVTVTTITAPTTAGGAGSIAYTVGGTVDNAQFGIIKRVSDNGPVNSFTIAGDGSYTAAVPASGVGVPLNLTVYEDAQPTPSTCTASANFTVPAYVPPVNTCTDPEANNYGQVGACTYDPRMALAAALPELAPLGLPVYVTLAAAEVAGATAAHATCLLDLGSLGGTAGVQVRVDGYLFTSGPLIVPGRFVDGASLLDAIQNQPALTAAYVLSQPTTSQVLLTSRNFGLPGTPTVTSSNAAKVSVTATAGVAGLWSQKRYRWGCYLEIWVGCGSVFGGPTDKTTAQLAQRLPLDYRADNAYRFDVAAALRGFTGHDYPLSNGTCPDRLVSYFVRFGEEYADTATGLRRARTTYESDVAWGLEAMEVPPRRGGRYVLTARPQPWLVAAGDRVPACWLQAPATSPVHTTLRYRLATSRDVVARDLGHETATGKVTQANDYLPSIAGLLSGTLCNDVAPLATVTFGAVGQALTFANRQGGFDTVYFAGTPEDTGKRTASTYTNAAGPQNLSAEMALTERLQSGPLPFPVWDWLRRELGVSPAVWLELPAGPQARLVAEVATEADHIKGEYSLSVDLQPAPTRGLTN